MSIKRTKLHRHSDSNEARRRQLENEFQQLRSEYQKDTQTIKAKYSKQFFKVLSEIASLEN